VKPKNVNRTVRGGETGSTKAKPGRRPLATAAEGTSGRVYAVPALEKGLDVLELLAHARSAMSLNAIAKDLGRSRQELFRVVTCLHARGYLLRDAAASYRLSTRMFEVGSRHAAQQVFVSLAMPHMERLADLTGESVQMGVLEGDRILIIATAVGSSDLQVGVKVGSSIALYYSNVGQMLMAYSSEEKRREFWKHREERRARGEDLIHPEITDWDTWQAMLDTVRRDGYIAGFSPMHVGSMMYVAPVLDSLGNVQGLLSCTRLVPVVEQPRRDAPFIEAVVACGRAISAEYKAATTAD
jgi:DNA-binding IclR family transcriptional regulator